MATPIRGKFEIGGKTLIYDINAVIDIEEKLGVGARELGDFMANREMVGDLRTLLWAGLQEHHPEMDLRAVGRWMTEIGEDVLVAAVDQALNAAMPQKGDAGANPTKARAGATKAKK